MPLSEAVLTRLAWLDLSEVQHRFASSAGVSPLIESYWRLHAADHDRFAADCAALTHGTGLSPDDLAPPLLVLVLLTDSGPDDAPTLLRAGTHRAVARLFSDMGDPTLYYDDVVHRLDGFDGYKVAEATGDAGDVYLCHPLIVHSGQAHRGTTPRFAAQVGVTLVEPITLQRSDGAYSPLEEAVRLSISGGLSV